jgi:hypothetical protein
MKSPTVLSSGSGGVSIENREGSSYDCSETARAPGARVPVERCLIEQKVSPGRPRFFARNGDPHGPASDNLTGVRFNTCSITENQMQYHSTFKTLGVKGWV